MGTRKNTQIRKGKRVFAGSARRLSRNYSRQEHDVNGDQSWSKTLNPYGFSKRFRKKFGHLIREDSYQAHDLDQRYSSNGKATHSQFALEIAKPLIEKYANGLKRAGDRSKVESIALATAEAALSWHNQHQEASSKRKIIQNHVEYVLFMHEASGVAGFDTFSGLNFEGLLDAKGNLRLLSVFEKEAAHFGIETKVNGAPIYRHIIDQEAGFLLENSGYSGPNGIYLLTRDLSRILRTSDLSPTSIYDSLSHNREKFKNPTVSLNIALLVKELLETASDKKLTQYKSDTGLYVLGKDLKEKTAEPVYLPDLASLLASKEHVSSLVESTDKKPQNVQTEWNTRSFRFTVGEMESIIGFLSQQYQKIPSAFIQKYGSIDGDYKLASDLAQVGVFRRDMAKLHDLTGSGQILANLLGVSDAKFQSRWKPSQLGLDYSAAQVLISHLEQRYQQQPELFLQIYTSPIAPVILSKEMSVTYGIEMPVSGISDLLYDPKVVSALTRIPYAQIRNQWNIEKTRLSLSEVDEIVAFLKHEYEHSPTSFFSRYESNAGTLAADLQRTKGLEFHMNDLEFLVKEIT